MTLKKIPYGIASYQTVKQGNYYYLDKTKYIPQLEDMGLYLLFIRPRRFGKSLLLSMLGNYYDIATVNEFDALFQDSYIYQHPTPEKNRYLILFLNFSLVNPDLAKVEESFNDYVNNILFLFAQKYPDSFDTSYFTILKESHQAHQKLQFTLDYLGSKGQQAYVFIDEYDNFTNTIMATQGQLAYREITHGSGFYRFFFNVLKGAAGTNRSGLARLFITGVSPVTMDDVTSGFNIGQYISLERNFNEMLGFTQQDVIDILNYYSMPVDQLLPLMQKWYNHYRFARKATQDMFNTDMVLYFIKYYLSHNTSPDAMIDQNVKIDYGKLRHLMTLNRQLNGNFSYLQEIITNRQLMGGDIQISFPMEQLTKPINFISLLYYFGLLSYTEDEDLQVPNETVLQLMYSYFRDGYEDVNIFRLDVWRLVSLIKRMAYQGEWQAVFKFLAREIEQQTAIRDYLTGEKVIQTFLLAYLNVSDYFMTRTEHEMGKGFVDLYLEPFLFKHERLKFGYLIELKYLTRSEFNEILLQEKIQEGQAQLQRYRQDPRLQAIANTIQLKSIVMVYAGWELKVMQEI